MDAARSEEEGGGRERIALTDLIYGQRTIEHHTRACATVARFKCDSHWKVENVKE